MAGISFRDGRDIAKRLRRNCVEKTLVEAYRETAGILCEVDTGRVPSEDGRDIGEARRRRRGYREEAAGMSFRGGPDRVETARKSCRVDTSRGT